jgi:hypothetical protein
VNRWSKCSKIEFVTRNYVSAYLRKLLSLSKNVLLERNAAIQKGTQSTTLSEPRRFITVFTKAHFWFQLLVNPQYRTRFLMLIVILSSNLRLSLSHQHLFSVFPNKYVIDFLNVLTSNRPSLFSWTSAESLQLWESIAVPKVSHFYPWPSSRDSFKTVSRTGCLDIQFDVYVGKIYGFISVKKFATFSYVVGVFHRKLCLIFENF